MRADFAVKLKSLTVQTWGGFLRRVGAAICFDVSPYITTMAYSNDRSLGARKLRREV